MYIYRGGQLVEQGVYWESEDRRTVRMRAEGFLPGTGNDVYFRLPESYLLIPVLLCGMVISVAFPFGIGVAMCTVAYMAHKVLYALITASEEVMGEAMAYLWVQYKPHIAYFTGRKRKKSHRSSRGGETKSE